MTALQALKDRDVDALIDALSDADEANEFKRDVLPDQSPDDCRWFWQQLLPPKELEEMMGFVRAVCLKIAKDKGLVLCMDYSLGTIDGLPTMICSPSTSLLFYTSLPADRHSVLRFYLQLV